MTDAITEELRDAFAAMKRKTGAPVAHGMKIYDKAAKSWGLITGLRGPYLQVRLAGSEYDQTNDPLTQIAYYDGKTKIFDTATKKKST